MVAASLPPWLTPWSSSQLHSDRLYRPTDRLRDRYRPRLTIFTYGHGNSAPILSSWSEGSGAGTPPSGGLRWERVPLDRPPWHVEIPVPLAPRELPAPYDVTIHTDDHDEDVFSDGLTESDGASREAALSAYGGIMRGWAVGAVLLALLIVLVRIGERYLDWKILLRRRRLHRERQRANIRTNGRSPPGGRRPPPYSVRIPAACTELKAREECPPPYALVHGANKPGVDGVAPPHRIGRLLQACGIDMAREILPPADDSFGAITYYAPPPVDYIQEPLTAPDCDLDPPPIYSSAEHIDEPTDTEPTDVDTENDEALDNADPNYDDVASNDTDADPTGSDEAPKDGSVAV